MAVLYMANEQGFFDRFSRSDSTEDNEESRNNKTTDKTKTDVSEKKAPVKKARRQISYTGRISEAKKLMDHDYFAEASIELAEAIKLKPEVTEPYLLLAEVYLQTNDQTRLRNLILELEKRFPSRPEVLILSTREQINKKQFAELSQLFNSLEKLPPTLQYYQAALFGLQNSHKEATEVLAELSKLPVVEKDFKVTDAGIVSVEDNTEPHLTPELETKVDSLLSAYREFENYADGKNAHLFATLSKSLSENNEPLLGLEMADIALKEDLDYIDAWILRGYANYRLRNYEAALQDFEAAYKLDAVRPEIHYFLALTYFEQEEFTKAALFFEKALEYDFEFSAEVRWKLLEIFARQGKHEKVIEIYRELLDYDTDPEKFTRAIHTAIDILGKPEIALEFTSLLLEKNPEDVFTLNMHGWALTANQQFVDAETVLLKAEAMDKNNPRTPLNLGILYEAQSKKKEAQSEYRKVYERGQDDAQHSQIVNAAVERYNRLVEVQ